MRSYEKQILITGADGYIGSNLTRALHAEGQNLVLAVRATDRIEFDIKLSRLCKLLGVESPLVKDGFFARLCNRVTVYGGNLTSAQCLEMIPTKEIGTIVHSAAATRFNIDELTAHETNVLGTRHVVTFAERCVGLNDFVFVSSLYASGLTEGTISEVPFPGDCGFANNYERSKWQCEVDLISNDRIPWRIARLSTVIADNASGHVTQHNATHNTLKLFHYGLLSLIPGKRDTPMYFITGDFATDALMSILDASSSQNRIFHVSHELHDSIELGHFIDVVFEAFSVDQGFRKRRILAPVFCNLEDFTSLTDAMSSFGQSVMVQASASITPFAEQLFSRKVVLNEALRGCMQAYGTPDPIELVKNVCLHMTQRKWRKVGEYAI